MYPTFPAREKNPLFVQISAESDWRDFWFGNDLYKQLYSKRDTAAATMRLKGGGGKIACDMHAQTPISYPAQPLVSRHIPRRNSR